MNKKIVGGILIIIMIILLVLIVINRDTIFQNKLEMTYPDGCVETYINDVLVTEECTIGRQMHEEQQQKESGEFVWLKNAT